MKIEALEALVGRPAGEIRRHYGGKALGLVEAKGLGLNIPESWLISIECYDRFLQSPEYDHKRFLSSARAYIDKHLDLVGLPECTFAVRSSSEQEDSSEQSFAGIFESRLFIGKSELGQAIAEVWDSCHSLKALSYFKERPTLKMGVILQPMVEARYAGIAFSKHPSPSNLFENHQIIIEFAMSQGEKLVQGQITPIRLSGTLESLLATSDLVWIKPLLASLMALVQFHRYEIDIEFAIDAKGQFILLQERPVSRTCHSDILDLTDYVRKYKRALMSLDIQFLIQGAASFLASYLDLPYQLDRWMVMVPALDGKRELWVHELVDHAAIWHLSRRFEEDSAFLDALEMRYEAHLRLIRTTDYTPFLDRSQRLPKRFFDFCEFITPLMAHYYAPMFIIEALENLLLARFKAAEAAEAESDLFFMATFEIPSLMDLLNQELLGLKRKYGASGMRFEELALPLQEAIRDLSRRYGFLKCHQVYEEGYSPAEIHALYEGAKEAEGSSGEDKLRWERLSKKYLSDPKSAHLFGKFRRWLIYRNQEMELVMFAIAEARALFVEIAESLNVSVKELWDSSRELISSALERKEGWLVNHLSREHLVIYHSFGKTRLSDHVKVIGRKKREGSALTGKRVFGSGKMDLQVVVAFTPEEIERLGPIVHPSVLVTGMTTPDFIPYLKSSFSALITDEGGILCHAAIVAREIGLPCIVGVGCASERLAAGNWVRIDFDQATIYELAQVAKS